MQGMQKCLEKSCFRCKKNAWYVESNTILQPPKNVSFLIGSDI